MFVCITYSGEEFLFSKQAVVPVACKH